MGFNREPDLQRDSHRDSQGCRGKPQQKVSIEHCRAQSKWPLPERVSESFKEELYFNRTVGKIADHVGQESSKHVWDGRGTSA